ncbi:TonB family C-terminal domain-containing protein [Dyadobacter koreensis]|uniref:TonB family C-terminal domain-containing protein n=1 Tax=Dyadobacter koreensis TaxID=408657 RepID=A0A1H6WPG0_9BACT|nr:TonB family protein [Dyadobacter koreensis]SEJ17666.1 TonB family C-terminal domain-containing protein [Dyadobacter koreensis]
METLIYLAKVNICWILFYACYWLLFRKNTFFRWNRTYLIGTLLVSFLLPLIQFPETDHSAPVAILYSVNTVTNFSAINLEPKLAEPVFDWTMFLWIIPALGSSFMVSRIGKNFRDLFRIINQGEKFFLGDYTLILFPSQNIGSFSFLKWLVINKFDYENHPDEIIRHELVHIKQWHSLDILLIEFLKILFWFNPVLWFYKNSLQEIHEFLADEDAPDRDHYARFLVSYSLSVPAASLTNHFFNSSILKTRIQMIYKNRNSRWSLGQYLMIAPVMLLAVTLTAARQEVLERVDKKIDRVSKTISDTKAAANSIFQTETVLPKQNEEKITIEGDVIRESGSGLAGANVFIHDSKLATTTDQLGHFKLSEVPAGSSMTVRYVGYTEQSFVIEKSVKNYVIKLKKGINELSGPTFIAYQNIEKLNEQEKQRRETSKALASITERQPEFPGGHEAMLAYIQKNLKYPEEAMGVTMDGIALISFVVNKNGDVRQPRLVKEIGYGIDEEAIRVVLNMPKWEPARQNGKPVSMEYTLSIHFKVEKESKEDTRQGFMKSGLDESIKLDKKAALASMRDVDKFFSNKTDFPDDDKPILKIQDSRVGMYRSSSGKKKTVIYHFIEGNSNMKE